MALTNTFGAALNNSNNAASYAVGSFTPAINDRIIIAAGISDSAAPIGATDDQSGTYTSILVATIPSLSGVMSLLVRDQVVASAVGHIVTITCTGDSGTGINALCQRIAGGRTVGDFHRQIKNASGLATTTPTVVMDQAISTNNGAMMCIFNGSSPSGITEVSGWFELVDQAHPNPTFGFEASRINSGSTLTTVAAGSSSATDWSAFVVELYEASQPPATGAAFFHREYVRS